MKKWRETVAILLISFAITAVIMPDILYSMAAEPDFHTTEFHAAEEGDQVEEEESSVMPEDPGRLIVDFTEPFYELEAEAGLTLSEVEKQFPKTIGVKLKDGTEKQIPVTWICEDDFDNTEYDLYTFDPVFSDGYTVDSSVNAFDVIYLDVKITNEEAADGSGTETRNYINPNPDGERTLDQALGCTKNIVEYLEEHGDEYLGTPYLGYGDGLTVDNCGPGKNMNCTAFVALVLKACGGDLSRFGSGTELYNLSNWNHWLDAQAENKDIEIREYSSISKMLKSKTLKKGDIIFFECKSWAGTDSHGNSHDNHIGFFWGNSPTEDKFWHSSHATNGITGSDRTVYKGKNPGNQISQLAPKCGDCYVYVIPIGHEGFFQVEKSIKNADDIKGNPNYSVEGTQYKVYQTDDTDYEEALKTLTIKENGKSNVIKLDPGTYRMKETRTGPGLEMDDTVYKVTVEDGSTKSEPTIKKVTDTYAKGYLKLTKKSSEPSISDQNSCYDLYGAEYQVKDEEGTVMAMLTTDKNGESQTVTLPFGDYTVQESKVPKGYEIDKTTYAVKLREQHTKTAPANLSVSDTPGADCLGIEIVKVDKETGKSGEQGSATLEGAVFKVTHYPSQQVDAVDRLDKTVTNIRTWYLTTKYDASAGVYRANLDSEHLAPGYKGSDFYYQDKGADPCIPLGTITVEEISAPGGYRNDGVLSVPGGKTYKGTFVSRVDGTGNGFQIAAGNTYEAFDTVIRGGVKIRKRDLQSGDAQPEGAGVLKDAVFDIINISANPVIVDGKSYASGEVVGTITTDGSGLAQTTEDYLPYGTYKIIEAGAPKGYLNEGVTEREFCIEEDGVIIDMTGAEQSILNQVKRGDLELIKIEDGTGNRMANIPFCITSKTTGEKHVIVTDDNGYLTTNAAFNLHSNNTNGNDSVTDGNYDPAAGVWFGLDAAGNCVPADDGLGALPYDIYSIKELSCAANEGKVLLPAFDIKISRHDYTVDLGTLTNDRETDIPVLISKVDATTEEQIPGAELKLYREADGEWRLAGEMTTTEEIWQFEAKNGKYKLVETSAPFGYRVAEEVIFEVANGTVLKQVTMKDTPITVHTAAANKTDGTNVIPAKEKQTIIDTVELTGLVVGAEYKVAGWQMDKEKNEKLLVDGKEITGETTFTAIDETMTVDVEFTIDAGGLAGADLVTFEELYDLTDSANPILLADHKDIEDEGQTVVVVKPGEITTHTTASNEKNGRKVISADKKQTVALKKESRKAKASAAPRTGDDQRWFIWFAFAFLSAGIMILWIRKEKKRRKEK